MSILSGMQNEKASKPWPGVRAKEPLSLPTTACFLFFSYTPEHFTISSSVINQRHVLSLHWSCLVSKKTKPQTVRYFSIRFPSPHKHTCTRGASSGMPGEPLCNTALKSDCKSWHWACYLLLLPLLNICLVKPSALLTTLQALQESNQSQIQKVKSEIQLSKNEQTPLLHINFGRSSRLSCGKWISVQRSSPCLWSSSINSEKKKGKTTICTSTALGGWTSLPCSGYLGTDPQHDWGMQGCSPAPSSGLSGWTDHWALKGASVVSHLNHLLRDLCAAFLFWTSLNSTRSPEVAVASHCCCAWVREGRTEPTA